MQRHEFLKQKLACTAQRCPALLKLSLQIDGDCEMGSMAPIFTCLLLVRLIRFYLKGFCGFYSLYANLGTVWDSCVRTESHFTSLIASPATRMLRAHVCLTCPVFAKIMLDYWPSLSSFRAYKLRAPLCLGDTHQQDRSE